LSIIEASNGGKYVNVDTTSVKGIQRAKDMDLIRSGFADVIVSNFIYEVSTLFESQSQRSGKCFTLIRDPLERAVSMFHHLKQMAGTDPNLEIIKNATFEEYLAEPSSEDNFMVRRLVNENNAKLQVHHLETAKNVLGKCKIGLSQKFLESMKRFELFFGWDKVTDVREKEYCKESLLRDEIRDISSPKNGQISNLRVTMEAKNLFDMDLYEYAKGLFKKQS